MTTKLPKYVNDPQNQPDENPSMETRRQAAKDTVDHLFNEYERWRDRADEHAAKWAEAQKKLDAIKTLVQKAYIDQADLADTMWEIEKIVRTLP
jgi:ferric-dicitrate binding protein FerR (iron transport regulator)